jgi:hypothetical protein
MEEIKTLILNSKPIGARYYALLATDAPGAKTRYPDDSTNYCLEPAENFEFPGPEIKAGTYRVNYDPSESVRLGIFQHSPPICRIAPPPGLDGQAP